MAIGNAADIGYGFSMGTLAGVTTQITDFSLDGFGERSVIDVSSNISTNKWRIFLPGDLMDPGTANVEFNLLTTEFATHKTVVAAAKTTVTLTFPVPVDGGASAGTIAAKMFVTSIGMTAPMDDRMVGTAKVKLSDEPTTVAAA